MKAFGENIEEYHKLLEMPETMIIYRYFFEWLGLENGGKKTAIEILGNDSICNASAHSWWKAFCTCKENVSSKEWEMALNIIHKMILANHIILEILMSIRYWDIMSAIDKLLSNLIRICIN